MLLLIAGIWLAVSVVVAIIVGRAIKCAPEAVAAADSDDDCAGDRTRPLAAYVTRASLVSRGRALRPR
jgi:hypothetical protein